MDSAARIQRWLAALRIVTGGVFVYMGIGHALAGWATADGFERAISGIARSDPLGWYTSFMLPIVLGAPSIFGPLFVFGMIATGLGLLLEALTLPALLVAVWLSANNLLMGFGAGSIHHSMNVLMLTIELGFLWTGAWRAYSIDGLLFGDREPGRTRPASLTQGR